MIQYHLNIAEAEWPGRDARAVEGGGLENRSTQVPGVRIPLSPLSVQAPGLCFLAASGEVAERLKATAC